MTPWNTEAHTTPSGVKPTYLDPGTERSIMIDVLGAESVLQNYGETYDYQLTFRDAPGSDRPPGEVNRRFNALVERCRHADMFDLFEPDGDRPIFMPKWPHDSPSLFVQLYPTSEESVVRGMWGLIEGIDIDTPPKPPRNPSPNWAQVSLSLVYLADIDEFDSREAAENRLMEPGMF